MNGRQAGLFIVTFAAVLLGLAVGYLVFRTYVPPTSAAPPITPEVRQFSVHMTAVKAGGETLHHWIPAAIVVNTGDTVILKVTNSDPETTHGFALGAFNIAVAEIPPGQTQTFRFRANRPGIFHFGCDLAGCAPDHADQTGQLVVLGSR